MSHALHGVVVAGHLPARRRRSQQGWVQIREDGQMAGAKARGPVDEACYRPFRRISCGEDRGLERPRTNVGAVPLVEARVPDGQVLERLAADDDLQVPLAVADEPKIMHEIAREEQGSIPQRETTGNDEANHARDRTGGDRSKGSKLGEKAADVRLDLDHALGLDKELHAVRVAEETERFTPRARIQFTLGRLQNPSETPPLRDDLVDQVRILLEPVRLDSQREVVEVSVQRKVELAPNMPFTKPGQLGEGPWARPEAERKAGPDEEAAAVGEPHVLLIFWRDLDMVVGAGEVDGDEEVLGVQEWGEGS